jgi:hypothetical protein
MTEDQFPVTLQINAWCGEGVAGSVDSNASSWGVKKQRETPKQLLTAEEPADLRIWQDQRVGWGLVLPENETISEQERAVAADAPEPIRTLVKTRNHAPIFRYRADLHNIKLRRYYPDGTARDIALTGSERGLGGKALPWYLMIYASPQVIPWSLQYNMHQSCFVGRLDLEGEALENYVNALINGWETSTCRSDQPLVWSVNHGQPDITWLMKGAIAKPMSDAFAADPDIGDKMHFLTGNQATVAGLQQHLIDRSPALVVTTSHGMTGPLDDAPLMSQQLGYLVDTQHGLLQPDDLLAHWQPDGAIWYAHACCSAGGDASTSYKGLVEQNSGVERILEGVAALGAQVAPLPKALLGAKKPLRAFIGQVEPTFDWTLRAETGQVLTSTLCKAIYQHMHRAKPEPVGMAYQSVHHHAGELFTQLDDLRRQVARAVAGAATMATRTHLAALDRQSMVILGDPTVALPPLPH